MGSVGTAAMLPQELGGVVDPKLLVYGTANLRVVDMSITPFVSRSTTAYTGVLLMSVFQILGTHPHATAYAIGEQAADIIKAAHY